MELDQNPEKQTGKVVQWSPGKVHNPSGTGIERIELGDDFGTIVKFEIKTFDFTGSKFKRFELCTNRDGRQRIVLALYIASALPEGKGFRRVNDGAEVFVSDSRPVNLRCRIAEKLAAIRNASCAAVSGSGDARILIEQLILKLCQN